MPDYPDLVAVVGRVAKDPITKDVNDTTVTEIKVSQRLQYGKGQDDFGDSRLVTVSVWGEHGERVGGEIIKGMTVACVGTFRKQDRQYADFTAFQIGPVAMIAKNGTKPKPADDDLGF